MTLNLSLTYFTSPFDAGDPNVKNKDAHDWHLITKTALLKYSAISHARNVALVYDR